MFISCYSFIHIIHKTMPRTLTPFEQRYCEVAYVPVGMPIFDAEGRPLDHTPHEEVVRLRADLVESLLHHPSADIAEVHMEHHQLLIRLGSHVCTGRDMERWCTQLEQDIPCLSEQGYLISIPHSCHPWCEWVRFPDTDKRYVVSCIMGFLFLAFLLLWGTRNTSSNT